MKEEEVDVQAEFEELVDPIREKASVMAQSAFAGKPGKGQERPDFDEKFFKDTCDLSEHSHEAFDAEEYRVVSEQVEDGKKWKQYMKCENPELGTSEPALLVEDFTGSSYECATKCMDKSKDLPGEVVCCMHDVTRKTCEMHVGWQSMQPSWFGKGIHGWFGNKPKKARLLLTPGRKTPENPTGEMGEAEGGQEVVKQLVSQVNDMSLDGILNGLLSFYICMRWMPDKEFMSLATHELQEVAVDEKTPKMPSVTEDQIIDMVMDSHLTPLRCGSAIEVQAAAEIDALMTSLNTTNAPMNRLYTFSVSVQQAGRSWFWRRSKVKDAMNYDGDEDSVYVQDMRALARKESTLPWPTFVRSSNYYDHHVSKAENVFMICFGPRVASFPHKREGGSHILADANMAGCNGFWDKSSMVDHMSRIKKLFSPEMCFTYALRKELKQQFMRTFVKMNEGFEDAMANRFTKRVHTLDPTQGIDGQNNFDGIANGAEAISSRKAHEKYRRTAGLIGNAHAKWVLCPTKEDVTGKIGYEDHFFRDPRAYEKWIGEIADEVYPECRSFEDTMGCAICVIAVKDEHGCHARMNVTLENIFKAAKSPGDKYPYMKSQYQYEQFEENEDTGATEPVVKRDTGFCMVRKSSATLAKAARSGDKQDLKDAFFNVNGHAIVNIVTDKDPGAGGRVDSVFRFPVSTRQTQYRKVEGLDNMPEDDHVDLVVETLNREKYSDPVEEWSQKFIFTKDVAEISNHPKHKLDYFVSCPCSQTNFDPSAHFDKYGSRGFAEYWSR